MIVLIVLGALVVFAAGVLFGAWWATRRRPPVTVVETYYSPFPRSAREELDS